MKSFAIKIAILGLTALATRLHMTVDGSQLAAFATDAVDLGVLAYGFYRSSGMKLVPHHVIAIDPVFTQQNSHLETVSVKSNDGTSVAGKVVGAILLAFALSLFAPHDAFAQLKLTGNPKVDFAPKPAAPAIDNAATSFSEGIQKIEKAVVDKGIADLNAAITDATNHNDLISLPCWQSNLKLLQSLPSQWENPPSPIGIALGIQIQRDLLNSITGNDVTSLKVACAALWGDQLKIVANVGALIGIRIGTGGLF